MSTQPRDERRPYRAGRRAKAAAETRRAILDAANRLFVEHGYGRVTVADIAREAEAAVPTVYASTGGKAAILALLIDEGVADPIVEHTLAAVRTSADPRDAITVTVHGVRVDNERHFDLLHVLTTAAALDETAKETLTRADSTYRDALAVVAGRLQDLNALRPGLGRDRATDILWFFLGHHSWRLCVADRGWSWNHTEKWLGEQVSTALLGDRAG
ncbi:TetR/AcrR family transcriptional regulator [Streptomyces sp. KR55]|uniref:TetR/AcrR family transcriptional regulator n=1 Tax=Streptomyces sp. KR55 TaxID=3457425 RepID=UPI003FD24A28